MDLTTSRYAKIVESLQSESTAGGSDKRRSTRTAVHAKVRLATLTGPPADAADSPADGGHVELRLSAMTHDLSTSGVGLMQTMPLEPGTRVLIELPEGRARSLLVGVVRHTRAAANGIFAVGVEFTADAPPALAAEWARGDQGDDDERKRIQSSMLGG